MEPYILLAILLFTVTAFVLEWLPIEVTALVSLALLLIFNLVTPEEAISGFSNPAVVTVMMMFILSEGLVQSGVVTRITHGIGRLSGRSSWRATLVMLVLVGGLSAFINNTAAVSILIPVALTLGKRYRIAPSRLLIPLSFSAILGGTCTLIGTSTNLLVSSLAEEHGFAPFTVFEFFYLGGILFAVGLVYNLVAGPRLLPAHAAGTSLTGKYEMSAFLTEVRIPASSPLAGKTVLDEQVSDRFQLNVLEILRGNTRIATDIRHTPLASGDILIVRGAMEDILAFKENYRLLLLSDTKLQDSDLADNNNILVEMQLSPTSSLAGASLKEIDFRKRFGSFVLALNRTGEVIRDKVAFVSLRPWDTLLVFGPRQRIEGLMESDDFSALQEVPMRLSQPKHWWVGALTIPAVVGLSALGIMPILKASILGAVLLLVTRSVRTQQAFKAIEWTVIFLLAAILPLGTAMEKTGLAGNIAHGLTHFSHDLGDWGILAVLVAATMFITGFISNNAAAVLMVPIAASVAETLGISAKPLLMGVTFAASMSFFTPMGYQTNTMVYAPGGYRFVDYLRMGGPLNIMLWLLTTLLTPWIWPF